MPGNDDLTLLVNRATALAAFLKTPDGPNLIQGFKRANTILTQAEEKDGVEYSYGADVKFAEAPEEHALFAALDTAEAAIAPAMAAEDFATAMSAMAALRAPIDAFFTAVQVNADSPMIRRNRLNLLSPHPHDLPVGGGSDEDRRVGRGSPRQMVENGGVNPPYGFNVSEYPGSATGKAPRPTFFLPKPCAKLCCTAKGLPQCRKRRISPSSR